MTTCKNITEYPLISVIVPVYNAAAFVRATIKSIQDQDYPHLEIVLVNDGSKDGSLEILQEVAAEDARVIVVDQENKGLSGARNAGVLAAHGEYVGFVDSDDLIYPDMYSNLYRGVCHAEALVREHAAAGVGEMDSGERGAAGKPVLVMIGREEIDEQGNALPAAVVPPAEEVLDDPVRFQESLLLYTGDVSFCTKLLPRWFALAHPFEIGVLAEDFSLQMQILDDIAGVYRLPEIGYRVVHRKGSLTRRSNPSQFSKVYISIVEHADYIERELVPQHPELRTAAVRFGLFERLDYLLHVPIADMTDSNTFYVRVVAYLRSNFAAMVRNPYLTGKNKVYLTLLTVAPRLTRKVHWALRHKAILAESN